MRHVDVVVAFGIVCILHSAFCITPRQRSTRRRPTSRTADACFRQQLRELPRAGRQRDSRHRSRARPVQAPRRPTRISSRIIRKGMPGTPMPATNMSEEQAKRVVAYLRSAAATKTQRDRGRRRGARQGGLRRQGRLRELSPRQRRRLAHRARPDAHRAVAPLGRSRALAPRSRRPKCCRRTASIASSPRTARTVTGRLLEHRHLHRADDRHEGAAAVVHEGEPARSTASSRRRCRRIKSTLNTQELADVVSYLVSLKGRITP